MILEYFRNRRSVGWFVGAALLLLVIVAFVALYFPDFMGDPMTAALRQEVASVDGEPIAASEFLDRYRQSLRAYQEQNGGEVSPALARQIGLPDQVANELVMDRILRIEAARLGLFVTDGEISAAITESPSFQRDGVFVGRDAYLAMLASARMSPRDFEASLRQDLLAVKLQRLVMLSPHVSDLELEEEYRRRNENAALEVWFVPTASQTAALEEVGGDEARERYEQDPSAFETPVQRQVRFLTLSATTLAEEVTVNRREIQRHYNRNLFQYQTGEQAEASHILLTPETEEEEEASRELAQQLADRARSGEDFAELARTYSADEQSAEAGGSLGVFGPEEMVPEFSEAVFAMSPGEISDPVRSVYGFHVIRLENRIAAETTDLEEVREEIEASLREEKSAERLNEVVLELQSRLGGADDLEELAEGHPLLVPQESGFFAEDGEVAELASAEVAAAAFSAEVGDLLGPVRLPTGFAFVEVAAERPPYVPEFEEIEEQLLQDLREERGRRLTLEAAEEIAAAASAGAPPAEDPTPVESWFRGSPLGPAGLLPAAEEEIFAAPVGGVVGPFEAEDGYAVIRVNGIAGFAEEVFEEQQASFRAQLAEEKKQRHWGSFIQAAAGRYEVRVDRQAIHDLIG